MHFIGGHRYKKSMVFLMSIRQREDETLRSYITRFNKESLLIDEANNKFLFSLYKNDLKTITEVLYRATKYMNVEDALLTRKEKPRKRERQEDTR